FPPRCSGHDGLDNAFPQVIRIGLRHRFGPPEPRINAARLAHSHTIGNPRFNSAGKRSSLMDRRTGPPIWPPAKVRCRRRMRYRKDDGADPPILPLFPAHLRTKLYSIVVDLQFDATT